jgi:hypothetical protein
MDVACPSKTSVNFCQTTGHHIPEYTTVRPLSCLQDSITEPHPEPDVSNPHHSLAKTQEEWKSTEWVDIAAKV